LTCAFQLDERALRERRPMNDSDVGRPFSPKPFGTASAGTRTDCPRG
jgi:hypothetical protein